MSPQGQAWCWLCREDIAPGAHGGLLHGWPVHENCVCDALVWLQARWRVEAPPEASLTGRDRPRRLPRRWPGARQPPVVVLVGKPSGESLTIEPATVEEIAVVEDDEMRQLVTRRELHHRQETWRRVEQTLRSQGERPAHAQPRGRPWPPVASRGHQDPFLLVDEEGERVWLLVYNHLAGYDETQSNSGPHIATVMPMTAALRADLIVLGALVTR